MHAFLDFKLFLFRVTANDFYQYRKGFKIFDIEFRDAYAKKTTPIHNLTIMKGSVHVAIKREFADFLVNSQVAIELFNYLADAGIPDESYMSTMATVKVLPNGTVTQDLTKNLREIDVS